MEELPYKLKIDLAMEIHKNIYVNIDFFKDRDKSYIAWIGPLLKPIKAQEQEYIYKEGEEIKEGKLPCLIHPFSLFHGQGRRRIRVASLLKYSIHKDRRW